MGSRRIYIYVCSTLPYEKRKGAVNILIWLSLERKKEDLGRSKGRTFVTKIFRHQLVACDMMRRSRKASRDSSQDSPVTDNERDIIWGDSPPPRKIRLSTTPGRRMTRAKAAEQDLTDIIECMHPKENKESSTPPLLGLWMRNREEPTSSGKKKQKTARLTRRLNGRKLSRIGLDKAAAVLDDLRILTEWTGNLAAAAEETADRHRKDGHRQTETLDSSDDDLLEPVECDEVNGAGDAGGRSGTGDVRCTGPERGNTAGSRRRSTNHSLTDDMWDDDWDDDDDSIIRIATQVENEAMTQQLKQNQMKERLASGSLDVGDVVSPTQVGQGSSTNRKVNSCHDVSVKSVNSTLALQTNVQPPASNTVTTRNISERTSKISYESRPQMSTLSSVTSSALQLNKSHVPAHKPALPHKHIPKYAPKSSSSWNVASNSTTTVSARSATLGSIPSVSSSKSSSMNGVNPSHRTWQKPINKAPYVGNVTSQQNRSKDTQTNKSMQNITKVLPATSVGYTSTRPLATTSVHMSNVRDSEKMARVPPVSPDKQEAFDDSLDDLFGDNSLPDDMLLALLDNDSDLEEYTRKKSTGPTPSKSSRRLSNARRTPMRNTRCDASKVDESVVPDTQLVSTVMQSATSSLACSKPPATTAITRQTGDTTKGTASRSKSTLRYAMPVQPVKGMSTRSTTQAISPAPHLQRNGQSSSKPTHHTKAFVDGKVEESQSRRSSSQPVAPSSKRGGIPLQRCCSQQEIEQKRQAALAKRKKNQPRVSPQT